MTAILAFELRLLRGGLSVPLFASLVVGVLVIAFGLGRVLPFATETALWIAPLALLLVFWRMVSVQGQLNAMIGSLPVGPALLSASHLLFWALVSLVPAVGLALLTHRESGAGHTGWSLALRTWIWFLAGIAGASSATGEVDRRRMDARRGLIAVAVVAFMVPLMYLLLVDPRPWVLVGALVGIVVGLTILVAVFLGRQSSVEFLPSLTPKRVRVGTTSEPERGKAVPWQRRRDREGVRQARDRNARSPSGTLVHLLAPFWVVAVLGVYLSGFIGVQASRAGATSAAGFVVLLVILHAHMHLALPRWWFLRQTPLPERRVLLWLLAPLVLALLPSACVARGSAEATLEEAEFAPLLRTSWLDAPQRPGLCVPRALEKPLEHAERLPRQLPAPMHGVQLLRVHRQALVPDEADYFERIVTFFLRTRFHVEPLPGELRQLMGEPQSPERIAALAMWGGKRDADGELFVEGEFPLDLQTELVSLRFESMQRARGDDLSPGELPPDASFRLAYEAEVAQVLATHKRDGAVYVFGEGLGRVWRAFEGRIREARTRRMVLDLCGFLVLLLISLRWGLRDAASRWLTPLIAAALVVAWSQLAWWPIGTAAYVWSIRHFGLVLAVEILLAAFAVTRLVRSLRTLEARAIESL